MIARMLLIPLSTLWCSVGFSQYTYYNKVYQPQQFLPGRTFLIDTNYVSISGLSISQQCYMAFRKFSFEGDIVDTILVPKDTCFFIGGGAFPFKQYGNRISVVGSYGYQDSEGYLFTSQLAFAEWYDTATLYPIWSRSYPVLNEGLNVSLFQCMRKLNDNSFCVGGSRWTYPSADDISVSGFGTILAHLDADGVMLEHWLFPEDTVYYQTQEILELDNGKWLLAGMVEQYGRKDQFLRLFNPATGVIETEERWGGEWSEKSMNLKKMPDGNYYCLYDSVEYSTLTIWDSPDDNFVRNTRCHLRIIDPYTLQTISNTILPINEFYGNNNGFDCPAFEPTPDGGYIILFNYIPHPLSNDNYATPYLVKLNADFNVEWVKQYPVPAENVYYKFMTDLLVAPDGGYLCNGYTLSQDVVGIFQWAFKTDACGDLEDFGCPTAVAEFQIPNSKFQIFPNPTDNVLTISSNEELVGVSIRDITGKIVLTESLLNHTLQKQLVVSALSAGMYILEVEMDSGEVGAMRLMKE